MTTASALTVSGPTVANGLNADDLFALIEGVKQYTAKGNTQWKFATS